MVISSKHYHTAFQPTSLFSPILRQFTSSFANRCRKSNHRLNSLSNLNHNNSVPFPPSFFNSHLLHTLPSLMSIVPPSLTPHVLVTGATSFLATALIDHLLELNYVVHATYRQQSAHKLASRLTSSSRHVRLFQADLFSQDVVSEFQTAAAGCQFAVHVASPMKGDVKDPQNQLVFPAVDGTNSVLQACQRANVKRVIVVSSHMAVAQGGLGRRHKGKRFTESDWNTQSSLEYLPLYYAKTKAERSTWEFVQQINGQLTEDNHTENTFRTNMQVIVVNPAYLWGRAFPKKLSDPDSTLTSSISEPVATLQSPTSSTTTTTTQSISTAASSSSSSRAPVSSVDNTERQHIEQSQKEVNVSKEVLVQLCRGSLPGVFDLAMPVVHVRDVARVIAHLLQSPTANGRYIVCPSEELVHVRDMVRIIREMGLTKTSTKDLTSPTITRFLKLVSHANPGGVTGQYLRTILANPVRLSNEKVVNELGKDFKFTDAMTTLRETVQEIIDEGIVESSANMQLILNLEK